MALTDAERKLLDELEATLTAQDPKLASKLSQPHRKVHPAKVIVAVIGFLVGMIALVAGLSAAWWISVIGFVVMLASAIVVLSSWSSTPGEPKSAPGPVAPPPNEDFMTRLEKRWQDRQGQ